MEGEVVVVSRCGGGYVWKGRWWWDSAVVEHEWGGRRKNSFGWVREGPNIIWIWDFVSLPPADFCLGGTLTLADADYKGLPNSNNNNNDNV